MSTSSSRVLPNPDVDWQVGPNGGTRVISEGGVFTLDGVHPSTLDRMRDTLLGAPCSRRSARRQLAQTLDPKVADALFDSLGELLCVPEAEFQERLPPWHPAYLPAGLEARAVVVIGDGAMARTLDELFQRAGFVCERRAVADLEAAPAVATGTRSPLVLLAIEGCRYADLLDVEAELGQLPRLAITVDRSELLVGPWLGPGESRAPLLESRARARLGLWTPDDLDGLRETSLGRVAANGDLRWGTTIVGHVAALLRADAEVPVVSGEGRFVVIDRRLDVHHRGVGAAVSARDIEYGDRARAYRGDHFRWDNVDFAAVEEALELQTAPDAPDPMRRQLLDVLHSRQAGRIRHGRRTFLEHLEGTQRVLETWRQPYLLSRAGLLHSIYSTGYFSGHLFEPWERHTARQLVGHDLEAFVTLFCTIDFEALVEQLDSPLSASGIEVRNWRTSETRTLSAKVAAALLVVECANTAEQGSGGFVARCCRIGRAIRAHLRVVPQVLDGFSAVIDSPTEAAALRAYRSAVLQQHSTHGATEAALRRTIELNPWVGEPHVELAAHLDAKGGSHSEIAALISTGTRRLLDWGTPWATRYSWDQWLVLANRLAASRSTTS